MKNLINTKLIQNFYLNRNRIEYSIKRIIYILCFMVLCNVDQVTGSGTYETILGIKNCTLLIMGVIMITAYDIKDFVKLPYLLWLILYGLIILVSNKGLKQIVENESLLRTNLLVVGVYGILFIRMIYKFVVDKEKFQVRWIQFAICMILLIGMIFIRLDYDWPKAILIICAFFFLTDFNKNDLNNLFCGILDGIILGFFVIQLQAWMYRPYDKTRYEGMYTHPNLNALFYLCVYWAALGKWYLLKLKQKNVILRIPFILILGLIIGTMFYTGSRVALIVAIILTFIFLLFQILSQNKLKMIVFLVDGLLITISIAIFILPAYWLIRYIPMYVREPLYFAADEFYGLEKKVQKNDQNDSEKYVEFDEAIPKMFDRYLWFLDEAMAYAIESFIRDFPDSLKLEVDAAEIDLKNTLMQETNVQPGTDREYPLVKSGTDGEGAYDVRIDIYRFFWNKLSLIGNEKNAQGVWISKWHFASHCHNLFLQFAYDFGIIVGVIFILFILTSYITALIGLIKRRTGQNYFRLFVCVGYTTLFVTFGMLEIDWAYGQLPFTLFWLVQYVVVHKEPEKIKTVKNQAPVQLEAIVEGDGIQIIDLDNEDL